MDQHRQAFRLRTMARVLQVSRSGFYQWCARRDVPSARQQRQMALDGHVRAIFERHKGRYGAIRITRELKIQGRIHDDKTVSASLSRQGLRAKAAKKFKATTNSQHTLQVSPNLLEQDFTASAPNQKWVGDITYLWTDEGWLYLAVILDLYSRKVIGWAMSERMTADIVCDALAMGLWRRGMPKGVIVHSDRGSQYCSDIYRKLIKTHKLRQSMSAKGNCYDNACAESFFHSLKVEAVHGERFASRASTRQTVFEYIEAYYNQIRQHSANGYVSPAAFEEKRVA